MNSKLEENSEAVDVKNQWLPMAENESVLDVMTTEMVSASSPAPVIVTPDFDSLACHECGKYFAQLSEMLQHQCTKHLTSARPAYQCSQCSRKFVRLRSLEEHVRRHSQSQDKNYICAECGTRFATTGEMARHQLRVHLSAEDADGGAFHCDVCNKDLASAREQAEHRDMHRERVACPECDKTFTLERSMRAHVQTFHTAQAVDKPFSCDICGHSFIRANLVRIHRRTHTGERPFQCEVCGRRFICRGDLNKHTRLHVDGYMYRCKTCGKELKTSRESADHRRMHTTGINCPVCGKSFTRYDNMQAHVRGTHDGERRFRCDECGKAFVFAQNLRHHRRQHQANACVKCSVKFSSRSKLLQHLSDAHADDAETTTSGGPVTEYQVVYVIGSTSQLKEADEEDAGAE